MGEKKIIIGLERIVYNKILIFKKKDTTYQDNYTFTASVSSKYINDDAIQKLEVRIKKDNQIYIQASMFNEFLYLYLLEH